MADINDDLYAEIENGTTRVSTLAREGKAAAALELGNEVESMISSIKGKGSVARRREFRDAVTKALNTPASAAVVPAAAKEIEDVYGLEELITEGSAQVRAITVSKYRGGEAIAGIILRMRQLIFLPDGRPDLTGRSHLAKQAAGEIYERVLKTLADAEDSEEAEGIRLEIGSIQKSAQNAMRDVLTGYFRSLDSAPGADLDVYTPLMSGLGAASAEISEAYGFKLYTRAEQEADRRAARKALEAKRDGGKKLTPEEEATLAGDKYLPLGERMDKLLSTVGRAAKAVDEYGVSELDSNVKKSLRADVTSQIEMLSALLAKLA